jgi:hypothetical protein
MRKIILLASFCLLLVDNVAWSQHVEGGGYAFDVPRLRPTTFDRIPKSSFPISRLNASDQKRVDLAIEAAHGFWTQEAETQMREVIHNTPDHPMLYMTAAFIQTIFGSGDYERGLNYYQWAESLYGNGLVLTDREQRWYQAMKAFYDETLQTSEQRQNLHITALEGIVDVYPDDLEAKSFLALAYWLFRVLPQTDPELLAEVQARTDTLIDQVLAQAPEHPAHHYKIHLWNNGQDDARAKASARASGPAQSHTAHLWHMPAHIFTNTGDRFFAMMQSEIAHRVDHKQMLERELMPTQIHNYYHNYRDYTFGHMANSGIVNDAVERAVAMLGFGRLPHEGSMQSHQTLAMKILYILEAYQKWDVYLNYLELGYFNRLTISSAPMMRGFEAQTLRMQVRALTRSVDIYRQHQATVVRALDRLTVLKAEADVGDPLEDYVTPLYAESKLWSELASQREQGQVNVSILSQLVEFGITPKSQLMMLAQELGHHEVALQVRQGLEAQIDSLKLNDLLNVYAHLRETSGDVSQIEARIVQTLVPPAQASDLNGFIVAHAYAQDLARMLEAARSKHADFLHNLPSEYDYLFAKPLAEYGPRNPQTWQLPSYTGSSVTVSDSLATPSENRAKVFVFAVGPSCPLCRTQIERFIALQDRFSEAGIDVVLVTSSGEQVSELRTVRDPNRTVHRRFGIWDSFTNGPLHGVVLVDDQRNVRWNSITEHAIEDVEFLLNEFQRVLAFK